MFEHALAAVLSAYPVILDTCRRRMARGRSARQLGDRLTGLLEHLDLTVPIPVGDLAQRARVTPATVSLQLDRLVRLRLAQRLPDPRDGRRVLIRLTDQGEHQRANRTLLDPDRVRAALGKLPSEERDALAAGLRALARAAAALPATLESQSKSSYSRRMSSR